jgi:hypothetical protein
MTEAGNDAGDDLAIAVLTDQNMRANSAMPHWNHELLGMPEGEDNVASASIESVDLFMTARLRTHGRCDAPKQRGADWRQQRQLRPTDEALFHPGGCLRWINHH